MAAMAPKILTVMKSHETSLPVQMEALRAILHFLVPGKLTLTVMGRDGGLNGCFDFSLIINFLGKN